MDGARWDNDQQVIQDSLPKAGQVCMEFQGQNVAKAQQKRLGMDPEKSFEDQPSLSWRRNRLFKTVYGPASRRELQPDLRLQLLRVVAQPSDKIQ